MGAVIGAHCCLKIVTIATMNPPMPPIATSGAMPAIASSGEAAPKKRFQTKAALATHSSTRIPVLFTAPEMVIPSPRVLSTVRKVSWLSAGFEVLINCGIPISPWVVLLDDADGLLDVLAHCTRCERSVRELRSSRAEFQCRVSRLVQVIPNIEIRPGGDLLMTCHHERSEGSASCLLLRRADSSRPKTGRS